MKILPTLEWLRRHVLVAIAVVCMAAMLFVGRIAGSNVTPSNHATARGDVSNASLQGITTISVLVADLPQGAKVLDLTKEGVEHDIESKLRLAGIRVVTGKESRRLRIAGNPCLYVNISLTVDALATSIRVELDQDAFLQRNGQLARSVATWDRHAGLTNPSLAGIHNMIDRQIDAFAAAWRSANPDVAIDTPIS